MSSRLMSGGIILLFVLVVNFLLAFITTGATATGSTCQDTNADGQLECSSGVDCGLSGCSCSFCSLTLGALPADTEPVVGALYILIMGFLLVLGIALVITALVPTLGN